MDLLKAAEARATAILAKRLSIKERKYKKRRRDARDKKLGKDWQDATLKERALFDSKFEYDPVRRTYVRRSEKLDMREILKNKKKRSRDFKRKSSRMGRRAAKIRRTYTPINTAATTIQSLFVDISNSDEPKDILSMLLSKAVSKTLSKEALAELNKYFSRPLTIDAYAINNSFLIVITEDEGLYTFEGYKDIISKIKSAFNKATTAIFETQKVDTAHSDFIEQVFLELGN